MPDRNSSSTHAVSKDEDDEGEMGEFPTEFKANGDLIKSLYPQHGPAHRTTISCVWLPRTFITQRNSPGLAMKLDFQVIKYRM